MQRLRLAVVVALGSLAALACLAPRRAERAFTVHYACIASSPG